MPENDFLQLANEGLGFSLEVCLRVLTYGENDAVQNVLAKFISFIASIPSEVLTDSCQWNRVSGSTNEVGSRPRVLI